ncbi:MAG: S-methyl-5-thioribose-1-phosphate isomerase [Gemmatimonadales bacterium]
MNVTGVPRRTIAPTRDGAVEIIDQTALPERFVQRRLGSLAEVAEAITTMRVRGAPLIGVAAAYGFALGLRDDPSDSGLERARGILLATRPTAVNLGWALDTLAAGVRPLAASVRASSAFEAASRLAEEDVAVCRAIGQHGAELLRPKIPAGRPLSVMTHCNAGWLAAVDWGTALAPVYVLHDEGAAMHVWVSETRPRSQGRLTAWELAQHGVPFTYIVDSAAGHLLQRGGVDAVLVGTDRTMRSGDVTNKIGTYLKALAAREAGVPFYVAAPSSSIDWSDADWRAVPIEERAPGEVTADSGVKVANPAFDVTPARLVTRLITERGVCAASREGLATLFPEHGT